MLPENPDRRNSVPYPHELDLNMSAKRLLETRSKFIAFSICTLVQSISKPDLLVVVLQQETTLRGSSVTLLSLTVLEFTFVRKPARARAV
jgi:hypothetical protein